MSESKWIRNEGKEIIFYLMWSILLAFVAPIIAGLSLRGFSESFVSGSGITFGSYLGNFIVYIPFLIIALFVIIFPIARLLSLKENQDPATTPNPSWFRIFTESFIYNPEENGLMYYLSDSIGLKGKRNFMHWSLNPLRVLVISILFFGIYGMFLMNNPQIAVSGVPQLTLQQFTPTSEVIFGSFVPAVAENGTLMFLFFLFMGIVAYFTSKHRFPKGVYFGFGILVCILMGLTWMSLHSIVYGNSDTSLIATFIFGFFGSFITLLTGIFIPWAVWHISNNAFRTLANLATVKNDVVLIVGVILFVITIIWIGIEIYNHKRKKSNLSIPEN